MQKMTKLQPKNANREKNGTGKRANDVSWENLAVLFTGQKYVTF